MSLLGNSTPHLTNSLLSWNPPTPIAPISPNFVTCDPFYGAHMSSRDADWVAGQLPIGGTPVEYFLDNSGAPNHIPSEVKLNLVSLHVEYAGAFLLHTIPSIRLTPNELRGMAGYVSEQCVQARGIGGFVTTRISNLMSYIIRGDTDITEFPYPPETIFVTVTLGSRYRYLPPPGSYDPTIALALKNAEIIAMTGSSQDRKEELSKRARMWARQAQVMRFILKAWWDFNEGTENSTSSTNGTETFKPISMDQTATDVGSGDHAIEGDANVVKERRRRSLQP